MKMLEICCAPACRKHESKGSFRGNRVRIIAELRNPMQSDRNKLRAAQSVARNLYVLAGCQIAWHLRARKAASSWVRSGAVSS